MKEEPVLLAGDHSLFMNIATRLMKAGHEVKVFPGREGQSFSNCRIAIAVTKEDLGIKQGLITRIEAVIPEDAIIAVNTESLSLASVREGALHPARIIGANWLEPADTTCFLELIAGGSGHIAEAICQLAKERWGKEPYILSGDTGIRARLRSALVREAFSLVENGYAEIEDIDRACRNDPGYYLPFAGHFRYMDLMGPYAYGMVMKDLNKELDSSATLPAFFEGMIADGAKGMQNNKGFYEYNDGDAIKWAEQLRVFSGQILEIMKKYPFDLIPSLCKHSS